MIKGELGPQTVRLTHCLSSPMSVLAALISLDKTNNIYVTHWPSLV